MRSKQVYSGIKVLVFAIGPLLFLPYLESIYRYSNQISSLVTF